ncbi:MAG TPA: THUMP domain-containing class I SAM-dependent methyltransferase [Candidatus Binataceae bacterium]|nr:THUMP domain-containing class I SAM-dependent methyltransferase [Candidatus Binataceae bacterium]
MNRAPRNPNRSLSAAASIRAAADIFIVHTQPGFESIAWNEIETRIPGSRLIATRVTPDRAGMAIFETPHPERLLSMRCAEDIFMLLAHRRDLAHSRDILESVRAAMRSAPNIDSALALRARLVKGTRAGRRLGFKVIARLSGRHEFRRIDFKRAIETAVRERGDHSWRLADDDADVEVWATMIGNELMLAMRLSDDRMRQREYKIAHLPGSLRPSVAAAMVWLSDPLDDDVFLDPMCGVGTVLIERAHMGRYAMLLGGDSDDEALAAARENLGPRYKPIEIRRWDAVALGLDNSSVSRIVTNMPWGIRHGTHSDNRRLYPRLLEEFNRVLKPQGSMVLLTAETQLMRDLGRRKIFRPARVIPVSVLGVPACVYVCDRQNRRAKDS